MLDPTKRRAAIDAIADQDAKAREASSTGRLHPQGWPYDPRDEVLTDLLVHSYPTKAAQNN
jgi:hypothetical protein